MPELPEVETIRRGLEDYLLGHIIVSVEINYLKIFVGDPNILVGTKILNVRRFGKVISIDLSNGMSIYAQVILTGQFIYRGPNLKKPEEISKKVTGGIPGKHTHVIIHLDKDGTLYYNDVRKFGRLQIIKTENVPAHGLVGKLGPEPLKDLSKAIFTEILKNSKTMVKVLLMDQSKIAGIGNIYANDALYLGKVNPKKPANKLNKLEVDDLYDAINKVIKKGIEVGGASELSYVRPDGSEGEYQKHFLAYDKEGELCSRCKKKKFVKITLGGRGTYFCPHCQKL
jgi:formamidopyrimidine-DNA glycosylase